MKRILFIILFLGNIALSFAQVSGKDLPLIPYPSEVKFGTGNFILDEKTALVVNEDIFVNEVRYLKNLIKDITGREISLMKNNTTNIIEIKYDREQKNSEAYSLNITPEIISISAGSGHGVFNAIQTIRQLLPVEHSLGEISLPAIEIQDAPAFSWRGMHLDVSRHFYTLDYLKKHIDRLSYYKFNKFHLHLTDDEGWRIEIKGYPELTRVGAWRTFNRHDSICMEKSVDNPDFIIEQRFIREKDGQKEYGGFYTQEEIKDLIKYAQDRHIEIIPEIDMPGHMMAAIQAYPFLVDGDAGWGEIFSIPICPCKEEVYTFCKNVLSEVIDLFPSKYIHIGADEVDKVTWESSQLCKKFMNERSIEDVNKLQSYFVHEMQDFIESKGKQIIAWDEILEGGTNPDVTVMHWRGWVKDAPVKAARMGNEVIMTPTNPLYFDYVNNNTSVSSVYHMDVMPPGLSLEESRLILGAQANLWAEQIPTEQRAEFQMYPRMLALAERVWTNNPNDYDYFSQRLLAHYPRLDALGINYRLPDIEGFAQENVFIDNVDFMVDSPLPEMKIRYTTDGNIPTINSSVLAEPLTISHPALLKMALFSPGGVRGEIYNLNFKPTKLKPAIATDIIDDGLMCLFFDGYYKNTQEMEGMTASETFVVSNIKVPKEAASFGLKLQGYIDIPQTGIYSFFFTCDDGGVLYIDEDIVVDNDGQHSPIQKSGQIALEKGLHPFKVDFIEAGGGYTLKLQYSFGKSTVKDIPDNWFKH